MKKYIIPALLLPLGIEILSWIALCIIMAFAVIDLLKAAAERSA